MAANGYRVPFGGDEDVLESDSEDGSQLCQLHTLKGWCYGVLVVSQYKVHILFKK